MFSIKAPKNELNCIYGVIRPLYVGARIFGFFPFSVNIELSGKSIIYFTFTDCIILVTQIIIYSCFIFVNLFYDLMATSITSPLLVLGMRLGLVFGLSNTVACLLADLSNRYQIFEIFKLYQEFDKQMQVLGSTPNFKRSKQFVYIYFLAWLAINLLFSSISIWICLRLYNSDVVVITLSGFFLSTNSFGILLSIYSFFLFSIRKRYSSLNKTLSKFTMRVRGIQALSISKNHLIENLMKLANLHDTLNVILDKVNRCYSIQAMVAVGISFTYVVFCLFSGYRGGTMNAVDENKQFYLPIVLIMWATFYSFFMITLLYAGHSTKNEGKFTGTLLHRAINNCYDTDVVQRLMAFSQQISQKIPDANCKLFSFDWTLMFSIIAATATYLIILIQFDSSGSQSSTSSSNNISWNN